ncbi:hypothetical protein GSI_03028 [Ganoderma sinense ZZ0214-1]|uniref:CxC1-like cysteine cluster associated with KDZ transposases domain-containing protein n=1 Tax=Ganoderma sinense ZZ0214-1 TaxID=1077348 RepID=A0A2G8SNT7_9APHY|nr:hypothetical protein GSI_03028 [Ganoderma sinense ZZ0214-1]
MSTRKRKNKGGVSGAVDIYIPTGPFGFHHTNKQTLKLSQQAERRKQAKRMRFDRISGMSFEDRQAWADLNGGEEHSDDEEHLAMHMVPPGEEAMFLSHEGGEDELCRSLKCVDTRLRYDRTERRNLQWQLQREEVTAAYLEWQAGLGVVEEDEGAPALEDSLPPFDMILVDFFETSKRTFRRRSATPTVAIAFQTLEAYRQLHRVCPRLSLQAQVRALCYLHSIPYQRTLVDQFSIAYDQYLDILAGIDSRVRKVLRQDGENSRMLNACAPCLYKLEDEPKLKFSLLVSMDGNQSLKLVDSKFRGGTPRIDSRRVPTDLFIPAEVVDTYKDEVNNAKRAPAAGEDHVLENVDITEGSAITDEPSVCEERWRNAGPEARKKMFALFAVSGVFVCLCRHGHVLVMCDMIRSGELMKYGLATISTLIKVYGKDIVVGYDIGFRCTPAFHAHSHNRRCQVKFLPLYVEGIGKEDFEGNERFFSSSNSLAAGTRLSTPFHRHQSIAQFVAFWSDAKHAETGNFIYQNYRQALDILENDGAAFAELAARLNITGDDCEKYLCDEREYLERCQREPKHVTDGIEYVQALMALKKAGSNAKAAQTAVDSADKIINVNDPQLAQKQEQHLKQLHTRAKAAFTRWETAQERVLILEDNLNISQQERWKPGSKEYDNALSELVEREYRLAIDNLERLVVQRLFELTKLGVSGLGYKLREKIGKALKARAEAIKTALAEFNQCAVNLQRPTLSWNEVMDMVTLAEFDLLRETREDIRQFPWAQRITSQAMNLYFNVKRAHEEIARLNVEIPRTFTSLIDRHYDYQLAIRSVSLEDPALARELELRWTYEDRISERITSRLYQTSQLPGFSGKLAAGKRVGRNVPGLEDIALPSWACLAPGGDGGDGSSNDVSDDEDAVLPGVDDDGEAGLFVDFIDNLG